MDKQLSDLIAKRDQAPKHGDYRTSDRLREEIESLGFEVQDQQDGTELNPVSDAAKSPASSHFVLFGSGEIAASSVSIYRDLFLSFRKRDLTIALVTSLAGFQPNVNVVYGEILDFFLTKFPDFNINAEVVHAHTRTDATHTSPSTLPAISTVSTATNKSSSTTSSSPIMIVPVS